MTKPSTVTDYVNALPSQRQEPVRKLIELAQTHLPSGFEERLNYGMPSWVVPHTHYAPGYHVDKTLPLPFLSIASQKSHIAVYHMGIYASPKLLNWFVETYPKHCKSKLNMGKSCIRLKNVNTIPYALLAELYAKMTPQQWVDVYESRVKPG